MKGGVERERRTLFENEALVTPRHRSGTIRSGTPFERIEPHRAGGLATQCLKKGVALPGGQHLFYGVYKSNRQIHLYLLYDTDTLFS